MTDRTIIEMKILTVLDDLHETNQALLSRVEKLEAWKGESIRAMTIKHFLSDNEKSE